MLFNSTKIFIPKSSAVITRHSVNSNLIHHYYLAIRLWQPYYTSSVLYVCLLHELLTGVQEMNACYKMIEKSRNPH